MAEGRGKAEWSHTSVVLCLLANVNRNPKKKPSPFRPSDFDPYHRKQPASKVPKVKIKSLRSLLMPKPNAKQN